MFESGIMTFTKQLLIGCWGAVIKMLQTLGSLKYTLHIDQHPAKDTLITGPVLQYRRIDFNPTMKVKGKFVVCFLNGWMLSLVIIEGYSHIQTYLSKSE